MATLVVSFQAGNVGKYLRAQLALVCDIVVFNLNMMLQVFIVNETAGTLVAGILFDL